tara:strand:- start:6239 stop:7018 length:780 start_codon:yes stop_codon:yes gene_type:complete
MEWGYTLSGLLVGFIVGLTGVGGGSLMTPLLILGFSIAPATAVGTDLLYASLTKAGGVWVHSHRGTIDWNLVKRLSIGSLPAALLTVLGLNALGVESQIFSGLITSTLGVALILTALALIFRSQLSNLGKSRLSMLGAWRDRHIVIATIITGAILGALVTITSVGAGALGMVALIILYPRSPTINLIGSDIAHAVPLTLIAGIGHAYLGTVDFGLLGSLLLGSLPGIYIGSHIGSWIPDRILRPILAAILVIIGGRLIW